MTVPTDTLLSEHAERAARTYGAAADHYCRPSLCFWDRWGAATVSRLPLAPGDRVLDVCCGAGASAISGYRGTVDALSREQRETLRHSVTETLNAQGVRSIRTNIVQAVARR